MFRQDAWAVQLTRQEFSEYDVASVLKRFFRDLPEPLLTSKLHPLLCEASCKYFQFQISIFSNNCNCL